jgi:hypothetical protein
VSAAVFNDFFLNKVEKLKASIDTSGLDPLEPARRQAGKLGIKLHSFTLKTVQAKQVLKSIKRSKKSACPDIDGISPDMLKIAAPLIAVPLAWVINSLICCQKVPSTWKRARIIPLHKKKEKNMASNYRPVSILPTCSKVMEDVRVHRLASTATPWELYPLCGSEAISQVDFNWSSMEGRSLR